MKSHIKRAFLTLAWLLMWPLALIYKLLSKVGHRDSSLAGFSQLLSLLPGKTGSYLRVGFFRQTLKHCDRDLFIGFGTLFSQQGTELSDGLYIGPQCNIGLCHIGRNTLLGSGVHVLSGKNQHAFDDPTKPIKEQGGTFESIRIGEDCWIGNGAIIMANIGRRCIVAAGSVVINDVPDGTVVAGNPAKVVKTIPIMQESMA
ncbi:MAG: acyltransferase [Saccharospirillum sp.]